MSRGAYSGKKWRQARRAAFANDNRRCQDCGSTEYLHAHHIKPVREFQNPEDAHYPDNLVVLCKYCHPVWEGRRDRPHLADEPTATLVREIVNELVTDTLELTKYQVASDQVYQHYIWSNTEICNHCHSRVGSETYCPNCGSEHGAVKKDTRSRREAINATHELLDRLHEMAVPVDERSLYNTVREMKTGHDRSSDDKFIFTQAVANGIQDN